MSQQILFYAKNALDRNDARGSAIEEVERAGHIVIGSRVEVLTPAYSNGTHSKSGVYHVWVEVAAGEPLS